MDTLDLRSILDRIAGIRHPCDLDVLLFFHRHPCTLLTSDRLVAYLGYDRDLVATSLETLIGSGLVKRMQKPSLLSRLYVLERNGPTGELLSSLLQAAAAREGRRAVMRLLRNPLDPPSPPPRRLPAAGGRPTSDSRGTRRSSNDDEP